MSGRFKLFWALTLTAIVGVPARQVGAETPPIAAALKLSPVQRDVDYDTPKSDEIEACTIKSEKVAGSSAWVVRDGAGVVLRQFSDSNADNVVDVWGYFRNGLEIYRDIDSNFNGKADQYRWFHTAGSRIGLDPSEDGKIDSWKRLSPEEAAEQVVAAVKTNDADRFKRLLLSADEAGALGLSKEMIQQVAQRTKAAEAAFAQLQKSGKVD